MKTYTEKYMVHSYELKVKIVPVCAYVRSTVVVLLLLRTSSSRTKNDSFVS